MLKHFFSTIKYLFSEEKDKKFYGVIKSITGLYPSNISYYRLAFQHSSLMQKDDNGNPVNNQRLEFLGDAVLGITLAHDLFVKFPDKDEGKLTKIRSRIVSRHYLNEVALKMGLQKLIKTQPVYNLPNTHIPGDTLEALTGAIFIDLGIKQAQKFIRKKIITDKINLAAIGENDSNYKSLLLEWGQKYKYEVNFDTEEIHFHNKKFFKSKVIVNETLIGQGKGVTKKEAHQNSAFNAFQLLKDGKFPDFTFEESDIPQEEDF